MQVSFRTTPDPTAFTVVLLAEEGLTASQVAFSDFQLVAADTDKESTRHFFSADRRTLVQGMGKAADLETEALRKKLHWAVQQANAHHADTLQVVFYGAAGYPNSPYFGIALGEIPYLSNYQFLAYKKEPKPNTLKTVQVITDVVDAERLLELGANTARGTCVARDLVNEPPNVLTQLELANRCQVLGKEFGFGVEVFEQAKIEALGMGGLLAVNKGSFLGPTFTILEHKPANAGNRQPIVLVGKGIVFDTGGLSLKPASAMVGMKGDMGGAAAVIGTFVSLALNNIPLHVIGLIPSTDNRPGNNAYTPNDVIKMYDGTYVEVNNTDAEGRMVLADALAYAKQYAPSLVVDLATLTGAAIIAIGDHATALMRGKQTEDVVRDKFLEAGFAVHERLVELPLWDDYKAQLKSHVADLKNVGGRAAGSITAGKFLEHFTDYPWVHLDIAGPAYLDKPRAYEPKEGTGVGVRLLTEFLRRYDD